MKRKTIKRSLLTKMILENIFFKSDFLMQDLFTRSYDFGEPPPKHYHFETEVQHNVKQVLMKLEVDTTEIVLKSLYDDEITAIEID